MENPNYPKIKITIEKESLNEDIILTYIKVFFIDTLTQEETRVIKIAESVENKRITKDKLFLLQRYVSFINNKDNVSFPIEIEGLELIK